MTSVGASPQDILSTARRLAGARGLAGVPPPERGAFIARVATALPGVAKAAVREALLAEWSTTLDTAGRAAAQHPNLARRILAAAFGHKASDRGDGTFSPVGARLANAAKAPVATPLAAPVAMAAGAPVASHEPLLHQGAPLIERTALAIERLGSLPAVAAFQRLPQEEQDAALLRADSTLDLGGHSGFSFSYAVSLGKALLGDRQALSAALHDEGWLKPYVEAHATATGGVVSRPKPTDYRAAPGGGWVHAPGKGHTVNIAQPFHLLPPDWQAENLAAAMAVREVMRQAPASLEAAAAAVHVRWLARPHNAYAKGGPTDVPYAKLSVEEKVKDVEQVLAWARQTEPGRVGEIERYIAALQAGA